MLDMLLDCRRLTSANAARTRELFDALVALPQRREPAGEGTGIGERGVLTEELQPPGAVNVVKRFEEASPKQP